MAASMKKGMSAKKRKLGDLSVDEFMAGNMDSSDSESDAAVSTKQKASNKKRKDKKLKSTKSVPAMKGDHGVMLKHKTSLQKLQAQDPEFYAFLKDEDESLLQFGEASDSDVTDSSEDDNSKSDEVGLDIDLEENGDDDLEIDDSDEEGVDDDEDDDSGDEINQEKFMKFLEKKNLEEIAKKKAELADFDRKKKENDGKKQKGNSIDKPAKEKGKKKKVEEAKKNEEETTKKSKDKKKKNADKKEEIIEKVEKKKKSDKKLEVEKKKKGNKAAVTEESDSEEDMDDEEIKFDMDSSDSDEEGMVHTLPDELEVMTDSDEEVGGTEQRSGRASVTSAMVKQWTKRFKSQPSPALLHEAVHAFKAAVQHTATESAATKYKVEGAKVYNAVVRMCLIEIPGALHKILSLSTTPDLQKPILPSTNDQKWRKIKVDVKSYLADVLQLMTGLSESNMVNVLLKHVHRLIAFYACFPKLTKLMLKRVINQWSSGEETSRILAFLCVNRMIRVNQEAHLENCVKQMYMAYVRNSKFTSPNTLPLINFMQRSFVEILVLDYSLAYQYAFIYIRQLAIHLRNAITTKKKESCQAVYNWQFIHCIGLWTRVLCTMYPNDIMEPLIYPLTQVIIGTIKLVPTQRYYPLRFHCVRALTEICKATRTFIPVLPFLMEVFEQTDFNKKHKNISLKPLNFACILKLSKTQLVEKAFKDGLIDQLYELLLEHFNAHAHSIGFPELALPALMQLKDFLKKCKVGNFTKQVKQIVDKVEEHVKFINERRRHANISLTDDKAIERWERECELSGSPINKFYSTWRKLRDRELMHQIAARDQVVDVELPAIKRRQKASGEERQEFGALFDTDSEDNDEDLTDRFLPPEEKKKLQKAKKEQAGKQKKASADDDEDDDDYSDFDSDELEQLAGSGDDDEDEEEEEEEDIAMKNGSKRKQQTGNRGDVEEEDDDDDDDDNDNDDDDDLEDDIVKDFTMSSDEDD